jgi:hypothetical protein
LQIGMSTAVRERSGCGRSNPASKSAAVKSLARFQRVKKPAIAVQNPKEIHENKMANIPAMAISDPWSQG